jgi:RNA polymerase sigma factor (sigma-70 family)
MSFPHTRRSLVLAVGSDDDAERREAFAAIVEAYWKAVYKYVRLKWQAPPEEAEDFVQGFFARAYEKRFFASYDPQKARFRTFLRTCLDGFVANERKALRRQKRGGDVQVVPLDFQTAEGELRQHEVAVPADVDGFFEREWARTLFSLAVERLRDHYASTGRTLYFTVFERYDLEAPDTGRGLSYAALAAQLDLKPTDVTNYLAAARRQFRAFVLERLRELTATDEEFSAEARRLLGVDV